MKVVAFSDTHNHSIKVPDADLVIFAGDFSGLGSLVETIVFDNWFNSLPHPYKILVPGNHEFNMDCVDTYYTNDIVNFNGISFFCSSYTLEFNNWNYGKTEEELEKMYDYVPNDIDVFVTHGPPYGILDRGLGSKALLKLVQRVKPKVHIFGHIHNNLGDLRAIEKDGTKFYNVSICDDTYIPRFPVTEIKL